MEAIGSHLKLRKLSLEPVAAGQGLIAESESLISSDMDMVLEIFKKSPNYFLQVDGCEPNLKIVQEAILGKPKNQSPFYIKEFLIIENKEQPIGTVELHMNHPEQGIVYVGLLLIVEDHFGKGHGREAYNRVESYVQSKYSAKMMRIGISDETDVKSFWKKMGFTANGHSYSWSGENKVTQVLEYDKKIML